MIKRYIYFLAIIALLFTGIIGCGGGDTNAPADAVITINPAEIKITDGSLRDVHTQDFLITVKDPNGIPLEDVELRITFIWSSPDGKFDTLYYDLRPYDPPTTCGDGTAETPLAQLTDGGNPVDSPLVVTTDKDGSYILRFEFLSGGLDTNCDGTGDSILEWSADLEVTSGSVFGSAKFEVAKPDTN